MCGRFVLNSERNRLAAHYGLTDVPAFTGGYNIAPSAFVPVVRLDKEREAAICHWGFIPHWVKEPVLKPINARAETLTGKPYFRDAFRQRRCLVPADGYYEWRTENGGKQPYFIRMKGTDLLSFAGLWSSWLGPDGPVESCVIITTAAKEELADIHDRMPVILEPDDYDAWLADGGQDLLRPCEGEMEANPVSSRVNNPRNQGNRLFSRLADFFCLCRRDDSLPVPIGLPDAGFSVGDADGFAAVFGVVQLFNGRKECVHVHEGDEARPVSAVVRHGTIDPSRDGGC